MRNAAQKPDPKTGRKGDKQARRSQQQALQREKEAARRQAHRSARRKKIVLRAGGAIAAAVALALAVVIALRGSASSVNQQAVAAGLGALTSDIASPPTGQFSRVSAPLYQSGKPELLFIGAQYCPHCAGQRWAIVKALDQFGTFSHLTSSANDDGTIPTFDLYHAAYTSRYVSLVHRDLEDRNHKTLESLSPDEQTLFSRYDPQGGIPLVLVGGYALIGDGYDLSVVQGKSFNTVERDLQRGALDPLVPAINAEANSITAFICHADGMRPRSACNRPTIRSIVSQLH